MFQKVLFLLGSSFIQYNRLAMSEKAGNSIDEEDVR